MTDILIIEHFDQVRFAIYNLNENNESFDHFQNLTRDWRRGTQEL